jgi:hypothetical protein
LRQILIILLKKKMAFLTIRHIFKVVFWTLSLVIHTMTIFFPLSLFSSSMFLNLNIMIELESRCKILMWKGSQLILKELSYRCWIYMFYFFLSFIKDHSSVCFLFLMIMWL